MLKNLATLLCVFAIAPAASPQTITASLEGVVTDPSGAAIQGAAARIHNLATNAVVELKTDQSGRFLAPVLQPGPYAVSVEAAGFKRADRTNLQLEVAQAARIEIEMQVGAPTETVEVKASAELMDATTSSIGHVMTNQRISNLPMNQRNPLALILLVPGVAGSVGNDRGEFFRQWRPIGLQRYSSGRHQFLGPERQQPAAHRLSVRGCG